MRERERTKCDYKIVYYIHSAANSKRGHHHWGGSFRLISCLSHVGNVWYLKPFHPPKYLMCSDVVFEYYVATNLIVIYVSMILWPIRKYFVLYIYLLFFITLWYSFIFFNVLSNK